MFVIYHENYVILKIIKKQVFNELRTTNHYPCKIKLFPKTPNTYGKQIHEIVPIKKPIINQL